MPNLHQLTKRNSSFGAQKENGFARPGHHSFILSATFSFSFELMNLATVKVWIAFESITIFFHIDQSGGKKFTYDF